MIGMQVWRIDKSKILFILISRLLMKLRVSIVSDHSDRDFSAEMSRHENNTNSLNYKLAKEQTNNQLLNWITDNYKLTN
jgi:hypothetical protein